jgi:2-hydroxyglutarate dehydrogenase
MFLRAALPAIAPKKRFFSLNPSFKADFTHVVIGAGVVGLAIARQLQGRQGVSTLLVEKHGAVGTETSSRNSEVLLQLTGYSCTY